MQQTTLCTHTVTWGAGCVFCWWARIQNWSIQIGDNGPWASQQTRGLCCIYSKLDQDARIAWLLVLPSSPMGTQSAYIAPLPRAPRTKNQKYAGISLSVCQWNISSCGYNTGGSSSVARAGRARGRYCIIIKVRLWEWGRALGRQLHRAWTWKHFVRRGSRPQLSQMLGDPGSEEGFVGLVRWDSGSYMVRCSEDRRWLLVMLSGLQQPDDRSSQSVGSSSYSADSGYTGGERVSCGDACRLVLLKWSGGSWGQTGNTGVIRSEAASDPWCDVISSYPLIILGHSRLFTWGAQISRWRVSEEVMLHQRSSNTIFINISRAKTDQIYPDNIIIGYPSTHQVGGKKKRAWGDSNIVGF